jgi:hypothetical protein
MLITFFVVIIFYLNNNKMLAYMSTKEISLKFVIYNNNICYPFIVILRLSYLPILLL